MSEIPKGKTFRRGALLLLLLLPRPAALWGDPARSGAILLPAGEPVSLTAFPERIEVRGADRQAHVVVSAVYESGGLRDVTAEAEYSFASGGSRPVARVTPGGIVLPLENGSDTLEVKLGPLSLALPVEITHTERDLPINFANDVVPIFSKHGCNAGGCHGKSGGQNGFQLSLFGFTPPLDYASLTRASRGRRVFPAAPEHSLLLRKASGALPHGGGERFDADSPEYRLIHRWMRSGLPYGNPDDPEVERITVHPTERTLERTGRQQLSVTAHYTDGHEEDVTHLAEFSSNEPDYLQVSAAGLVTAAGVPGQGAVLVRYKGRIGLFRALIPSGLDISAMPRPAEKNFIDRHVFSRLELLGIPPSELSSDEEFLRRASLDICGTIPTASEVEEFLADTDPRKRERLVESLVSRPEYAGFFALKWADLLRNRRGDQARAASHTIAFHRWLYESFLANKPFDLLARELIAAEGSVADNPAVAWYRALSNPKELVDDTAQVFLGTRIQCARCHHHPYEKWGQEDYWHFANFFSRLARKNDRDSRDFLVYARRGQSRLTDDEPTSASFRKSYDRLQPPGGPAVTESADEDPRQQLADWMASPENPLFARAAVNRYWKHFFDRGIVEPEDDLRDTNPPSNPELLEALAADFVAGGYDLKRLVRAICSSAAYQLSSAPNEHNGGDRQNFARYQPRRLPAELLLDAIDRVTGSKTSFRGVRRDARAIDLPDESSRSYFLEVFGKPERASACACERSADVSISQVIHLLNSREILDKIAAAEGRAAGLARDPRPDGKKVTELFLWAWGRPPRGEESRQALEHIAGAIDEKSSEASRRRAWEDLLWALINSKEFLFNR